MRQHGEHLNVHRQNIRVFQDVIGRAGRNVNVIRNEPDLDGRVGGRLAGEIESDRRLDFFGFACRLQMELQNNVGICFQQPRQPVRFSGNSFAGLPTQKMARRWLSGWGRVNAAESGCGITRVSLPRFTSAIEADKRVVHDFRVARPEFHRLHVSSRGQRNRNNEIAIHVLALGRQCVGLRHGHHHFGFAQLPVIVPFWQGWQLRRVAFNSAVGDPFLNRPDLPRAQQTCADEIAVARLRQPRRHVAARGDFGDLLHVLLRVPVIQQIKWRRLSRAMAGRAILKNDRRDVLGESRRLSRLAWIFCRSAVNHLVAPSSQYA